MIDVQFIFVGDQAFLPLSEYGGWVVAGWHGGEAVSEQQAAAVGGEVTRRGEVQVKTFVGDLAYGD